jgi:succinate dehydrogenase hydrophobic anchor subunit
MRVDAREPDGGGRRHGTGLWLLQVRTGVLLLVLVTVHMIANHFVAPGGLRSYDQVVQYVRHPLVLAIEVAFLVIVTAHALLGVRAVLLDRGPGARAVRRLNRAALAVGTATVAYGLGLLLLIASRA